MQWWKYTSMIPKLYSKIRVDEQFAKKKITFWLNRFKKAELFEFCTSQFFVKALTQPFTF